jgi:hypothetical protein
MVEMQISKAKAAAVLTVLVVLLNSVIALLVAQPGDGGADGDLLVRLVNSVLALLRVTGVDVPVVGE